METTNTADIKKKRTKKVVLFGLGTLAAAALAFFGIKHFKKQKSENENDTESETGDKLDFEKNIQTPVNSKPHTSLPSPGISNAFPLRLGAKGDKVRVLQQALIRTYGSGTLPKYGADGQFGNELASALKGKGYGVPLSEQDYTKITSEKKEEPAPKTTPLVSFDPAAIAKGIYLAITAKDFNAALTLMKSIRNTTDYSLVSEQLKKYKINGVSQTLVNASLSTFKANPEKLKIQDTLKAMGLKYDGKKWTL